MDSLSKVLANLQISILHDSAPVESYWSDKIHGAGSLQADEAIALYRRMYHSRMHDTLGMDFPALLSYLGEAKFARLTTDYRREYPSRSYTLNHVGTYFPAYLAQRYGRTAFVTQLSSFEQALNHTMIAEEPQVPIDSILDSQSPEAIIHVRFHAPATTSINTYDFDVVTAYDKLTSQPNLEGVSSDSGTVIIDHTNVLTSRRNYRCHYRVIDSVELQILEGLLTGRSLAELLTTVPADPLTFITQMNEWMRLWTEAGVLALNQDSKKQLLPK